MATLSKTAGIYAVQELLGGWGACTGAPTKNRKGPERSIASFRELLNQWEVGPARPFKYARSGDQGADGFLILGRSWAGPIVFFQAKNTSYNLVDFPSEFARMPEIISDWFGKPLSRGRIVVPIYAVNTILMLDLKERFFEAQGHFGVHFFDAVDILSRPSHLCGKTSTAALYCDR